jgi:hypothetical protein
MNAFGRLLAVDAFATLLIVGLMKFAPKTKKQIEQMAQGALQGTAPELAQIYEQKE